MNPASSSRKRWDLANRQGGMLAIGVNGSPIGRGADLMLVDDPIKNWETAQNPDARHKINETWWQGTMESRMSPDASVIIICSRWHEDDLSGFLQREYPADWTELRIPALCDDPDGDPLGREFGESYWPERWPADVLERRRERTIPKVWLAQYQARPAAEAGDTFPVGKLRVVPPLTSAEAATVQWCRGWDLAATEGAGDWTVGFKIGRYPDGRWIIGDVVRGQWEEAGVRAKILETAHADGPGVLIELPQDPGQAGKAQAKQAIAALSGYLVRAIPQTGAKEVRAAGFAAQVQAGNVDMIDEAGWNGTLRGEMTVFPNGTHDDQVDAAASAFNRIAEQPLAESGVGSDAFGGMQRQTM